MALGLTSTLLVIGYGTVAATSEVGDISFEKALDEKITAMKFATRIL